MNLPGRNLLLLIFILPLVFPLYANEEESERCREIIGYKGESVVTLSQGFPINSFLIDEAALRVISATIDSLENARVISSAHIEGRASIDGPRSLNERLAAQRADSFGNYLVANSLLPQEKISTSSIGEDWEMFHRLVEQDTAIPAYEKVLDIIHSNLSHDKKETRLRRLASGTAWKYLADNIFPKMRFSSVTLHLSEKEETPVSDREEGDLITDLEEPESVEIIEDSLEEPLEVQPLDLWTRKLYIKSNAPAWAMLWVNAAVEIDLARHWSASLPVYWSCFNYFKSDIKFRTLAFVPEVRWWTKSDNTGFFINAHFGLAWYNYAGGGEYRYQDYGGHTPAVGGGLGLGYRFYFCKNRRWSMEAAVGAGAYLLDYSLFENKPNGLIVGRQKKTFFGVDQAALSFSYSFGVQRKEVRR